MSPIRVQNYPFRGILSKGSRRRIRKQPKNPEVTFSQSSNQFSSVIMIPSSEPVNMVTGFNTARDSTIAPSDFKALIVSATSILPKKEYVSSTGTTSP